MSEWKERLIGEICQIKGGKRLPAGEEFAEGVTPFPYLRVTDMIDGTIYSKSLVYVKPEIEPFIRNYKISKDDLYVTIAGTLGMFGSIPISLHNAQLTENAAKLCEINTNEVNKDFLKYYLNSDQIQSQINKEIGIGGGVPKLALYRIERLKVKLPSISTQRKIAHILSTADAVIEKTKAAIAKYKAIKQGMLHDLFTRGIDPATGKLRPKYQDAPELYKPSKLGWIPKEWEVERIEKVSSIVTNGFVGVATPYYTTSDKGVPYLFGTNIRKDYIDFNDLRYISKEFHSGHIKSQLKSGDMLCVQSGHIGTCAVVPDDFGEANCHALIITRFFQDDIFSEFISSYLNSSIGQHELDKIIIGSTIKHINTSDLAKHIIPKPLIEEQKEISKKITIINNKIQTEQTYLHKLQQIKAGLMADLLSGKKQVMV